MEGNPYEAMLGVVGGEAVRKFLPMVRTGVIVSLSPLLVRTGDLLLDGADLLIDPRLLPRDREVSADNMTGTADLSVPGGADAEISNGEAEMTIHLPGELAVGDLVAMITPDGQTFLILCKGVSVP